MSPLRPPGGGQTRDDITKAAAIKKAAAPPADDGPLLTRTQCADKLTELGYPISTPTLATLASRGGGPRYRMFGHKALYSLTTALAWARARAGEEKEIASDPVNLLDAG